MRRGRCLRTQSLSSRAQESRRTRSDALFANLVNHEDLTDDILKLAEENACQTIVVGRSSFPWFKETFHRHLADSLVRKATGITIWVVEQPSARL